MDYEPNLTIMNGLLTQLDNIDDQNNLMKDFTNRTIIMTTITNEI